MGVQHFSTAEAMSRHQRAQELSEALSARALCADAFSQWLRQTLDPLQRLASLALEVEDEAVPVRARCFRDLDEKGRFDDARELARALRLALSRQTHARID